MPVPTACPRCVDAVREPHVTAPYQEDLPPVPPIVRCFDVDVGQCDACARRVQKRQPLRTSDALGAAAVQLGPHALTLAVSPFATAIAHVAARSSAGRLSAAGAAHPPRHNGAAK
jgi:hypothetical protein